MQLSKLYRGIDRAKLSVHRQQDMAMEQGHAGSQGYTGRDLFHRLPLSEFKILFSIT